MVIGLSGVHFGLLLPFSNYLERQTFFRVVTRLKHSSLSRQTVAFWSANMSNFDSSTSISIIRVITKLDYEQSLFFLA